MVSGDPYRSWSVILVIFGSLIGRSSTCFLQFVGDRYVIWQRVCTFVTLILRWRSRINEERFSSVCYLLGNVRSRIPVRYVFVFIDCQPTFICTIFIYLPLRVSIKSYEIQIFCLSRKRIAFKFDIFNTVFKFSNSSDRRVFKSTNVSMKFESSIVFHIENSFEITLSRDSPINYLHIYTFPFD